MNKPTFKSASKSRKTSSRSGGSVAMVVTARKPSNKKVLVAGKYGTAVKQIRGMSPAQLKNTLVRLGISKPDGSLTAKYSTARK